MRFWYVSYSTWQSRLLEPLSYIYRLGVFLHRFIFRVGLKKVHFFPVPIIVVGNITVGGTGKTPCVQSLVLALKERGWQPGIVLRGYGGKVKKGALEVDVNASARVVGDEALMLAQRGLCPVVIGAKRICAVNALLSKHDCNVIISDDGLSHHAMDRDIEILVVDAKRQFGNQKCLPAGPLREPMSRISTVNCVLMHGEGAIYSQHPHVFSSYTQPIHFVSCLTGEVKERLNGKIHALAGIGHPAKFFSLLEYMGYSLAQTYAYPDHFVFNKKDIQCSGADYVIMTEKDAVKCREFADQRHYFLRVDMHLSEDFKSYMISLLEKV